MSNLKKETTNSDRKKIIEAYISGHCASEISTVLHLNRITVTNIIGTYTRTGRIEKLRRGGMRPSILNSEERNAIKSWIDENCTITLKENFFKLFRNIFKENLTNIYIQNHCIISYSVKALQ